MARAQKSMDKAYEITVPEGRALWLQAQKLDERSPFGEGPSATQKAIEHLGYVQIDTINVIERCHHHILYTRIPNYKRLDLHQAQAQDKSVFEYWTHALAYVPTKDFSFFIREMREYKKEPGPWLKSVKKAELQKVLRLIKHDGALSIRDIEDDVLVEKNHPWASRKPSKKALQLGFYSGQLVISERIGMLKKYDLTDRHFGWESSPAPATEKQILEYYLQRALRSQAVVSLDSICHLRNSKKAGMRKLIESKVRDGELLPLRIRGLEKVEHWTTKEAFERRTQKCDFEWVHLLSPFDPLVIQRKRLAAFFDYEHRFEAYVPKEKRVYGYFALPVLIGDQIVAVIDLKTDRANKKLLIQKWTWVGSGRAKHHKRAIEEELVRFEAFQLASDSLSAL